MGQRSCGCPICGVRKDELAIAELDAEDAFWGEYQSRRPHPTTVDERAVSGPRRDLDR